MADSPVTLSVLAQFHRDVILPDMQRVVSAAVQELRLDFDTHFDAVYQRLDRLESEYQMLVAGLRRVEERLERVEERLERFEGRLDGVEKGLAALTEAQQKLALRSDLDLLKGRVDSLQAQIRAIEARLAS